MAQVQKFVSNLEEPVTLSKRDVQGETRFDTETVQKIIALAAQFQTEHQETLSATQVETIGSEVGLAPEFVQRALAQIVTEGQAGRQTSTERQTTTLRLKKLTRRAKITAVSVPVAYGLLSYSLLFRGNNGFPTVILAFFGAPALAVLIGFVLKSKRLGTLSGSLVGFSIIQAIAAAESGHNSGMSLALWFALSLGFASGGAVLGFSAASFYQNIPSMVRTCERIVARIFPELAEVEPRIH